MNAIALNLPIWTIIGLFLAAIFAFVASEAYRNVALKVTLAIILPLAASTGAAFGLTAFGYTETGRGTHVGYVTAIETDGLWFKTTTVHFKTDNAQSQEDHYCAADPKVIDGLRQASERKQRVEILFSNHVAFGPGCEFDYSSTIESFRPVS